MEFRDIITAGILHEISDTAKRKFKEAGLIGGGAAALGAGYYAYQKLRGEEPGISGDEVEAMTKGGGQPTVQSIGSHGRHAGGRVGPSASERANAIGSRGHITGGAGTAGPHGGHGGGPLAKVSPIPSGYTGGPSIKHTGSPSPSGYTGPGSALDRHSNVYPRTDAHGSYVQTTGPGAPDRYSNVYPRTDGHGTYDDSQAQAQAQEMGSTVRSSRERARNAFWYWIKDMFGTREGEEFLDKLEKITSNKRFTSRDLSEVRDALKEHYKANESRIGAAINRQDAKKILDDMESPTTFANNMKDIFGRRKNEGALDAFEKKHWWIRGGLSDKNMQDIVKYRNQIGNANENQQMAMKHQARFKEIVKKIRGV